METEFYRSPTELLPTFTLVLAASLVGINSLHRIRGSALASSCQATVLPACAQYSYYEPAALAPEPAEQLQALRHFAETLLSNTENNPQPVVDLLNHHFWDLV
jgi:hypothetical protein